MRLWPLVVLLLASACDGPIQSDSRYITIDSRDAGDAASRLPLYRIALPEGWIAVNSNGSVADTMLPLIECHYEESGQTIRLTIHNFPYESTAMRIPPQAQIARWKEQFDSLSTSNITPQAFAGFVGMHLYAEGLQKGSQMAVSAWAMQLAPEHDRSLAHLPSAAQSQMRSDVTIKATGPRDLIEAHQEAIAEVARSFELLNPLPTP